MNKRFKKLIKLFLFNSYINYKIYLLIIKNALFLSLRLNKNYIKESNAIIILINMIIIYQIYV